MHQVGIADRQESPQEGVQDKKRPTTVKTRILASNQHVVRFDRENSEDINSAAEKKLLKLIFSRIDDFDAIIFQDYNKGLLTPGLIKPIIKKAKEKNIITAVDPKFKNYFDYKGTCIFKPNLREAEEILNRKISSEKDIERAGHDLIKMLKLEKLVITLSSKGMAVFDSSSKMEIIPARSAKISNVSGAGDTVIATLVSYLCAGASYKEACTIANYAASLAVEDVSVIAIDPTELEKRLKDNSVSGAENRHDSK
ncbi:MAG: PfkB family carbohydrate kinase [Candidatus Delongbacteria bacterium]